MVKVNRKCFILPTNIGLSIPPNGSNKLAFNFVELQPERDTKFVFTVNNVCYERRLNFLNVLIF